jgi:hypothetical protein
MKNSFSEELLDLIVAEKMIHMRNVSRLRRQNL